MGSFTTSSLWKAVADWARKMDEAGDDADRQRVLLMTEGKHGRWEGVPFGARLVQEIGERVQAMVAPAFPTADSLAKIAKPREAYLYESDDAKEKGEARREDLLEQLDQVETKHARDAAIKRNGKRVGTVIRPTQEWRCPCGQFLRSSPTHNPDPCILCGGVYGKVPAGTREPLSRWHFRCLACGSGGVCVDLSKLGKCPRCSQDYSDTWRAGDPQGSVQKAIEALPQLAKATKKDGTPKTARTSTYQCDLCRKQILKGDPQRYVKTGSGRRTCEPCFQKHAAEGVDKAMALLSDGSTDEDWRP